MKRLSWSPKTRFGIAFGASMGIGHVLFRILTTNLGPVYGLVASLVLISAIAASISLLLQIAANVRHKPSRRP